MSAKKQEKSEKKETTEIETIMDSTLQTILKELELVREDSRRVKEEARKAVEEVEEKAKAERLASEENLKRERLEAEEKLKKERDEELRKIREDMESLYQHNYNDLVLELNEGMRTRRASRRDSINTFTMGGPDDSDEDSEPISVDLPKSGVRTRVDTRQVLVTRLPIRPEDLIRHPTVNGYLLLKKKQREYQHTGGEFRPAVDFAHESLMSQIVNYHRTLGKGTLGGLLTITTIRTMKDREFFQLWGSLVRSTYAVTLDQFTSLVVESVPHLESKDPRWKLSHRDYQQQLQSQLTHHLELIRRVRRLLYDGATNKQTQHWPEAGWQNANDKDIFGETQVWHSTLGRFAEGLKAFIGQQKLKQAKNHAEWEELIQQANEELGEKGHDYQLFEARCHPKLNLQKTLERNRNRSEQGQQQTPTQILKKQGSVPGTAATDFSSANRFRQTSATQSWRQPNSVEPNRYRENRDRYARQSAIEYGGYQEEDSYFSENSPKGAARVAPDQYEYSEQDSEYDRDYVDGQMLHGLDRLISQSGGGPGGKTLYDTTVRTKRDLPCYQYFYGPVQGQKMCDGSCGYRHDDEAMEKYFEQMVQKLRRSRFVRDDKLIAEVQKPLPPAPPATPHRKAVYEGALRYIAEYNAQADDSDEAGTEFGGLAPFSAGLPISADSNRNRQDSDNQQQTSAPGAAQGSC